MNTTVELFRSTILDWLYEHQHQEPGTLATVADFIPLDEHGEPQEHKARMVLRSLADDGLIMLAEAMGFDGTSAMLTASGMAEVEARSARRTDPILRRSECRRILLLWLYSQPRQTATDVSPFMIKPEANHEGLPFGPIEVEEALSYLDQKGLVSGIRVFGGGLARIHLTPAGVDTVERFGGSVSAYLGSLETKSGSQQLNIHGAVSGNVAWANSGIQQNFRFGPHLEHAELVLSALKEALPALRIAEDEREALRRAVNTIQDHIGRTADVQGELVEALRTVGLILDKNSAGSPLSTILSAALRSWMAQVESSP